MGELGKHGTREAMHRKRLVTFAVGALVAAAQRQDRRRFEMSTTLSGGARWLLPWRRASA
jgi:hypothetical protein